MTKCLRIIISEDHRGRGGDAPGGWSEVQLGGEKGWKRRGDGGTVAFREREGGWKADLTTLFLSFEW